MVVLFIQPVITTPRWLITSINTHFHSRPRPVPCVSRIFPRSGRHQRVDPAGLHHGSRLLAVTLMTSDIFTRWKRSADKYLLSPSRTTFFNSSTWARTWPPSRVRWLPVCGSDWETTWTPADGQRLVRQSHLSLNQPNNLITARSESDKLSVWGGADFSLHGNIVCLICDVLCCLAEVQIIQSDSNMADAAVHAQQVRLTSSSVKDASEVPRGDIFIKCVTHDTITQTGGGISLWGPSACCGKISITGKTSFLTFTETSILCHLEGRIYAAAGVSVWAGPSLSSLQTQQQLEGWGRCESVTLDKLLKDRVQCECVAEWGLL